MPQCRQCSAQFEITDEDRKFYEKMKVPEPTLCPRCRKQRRMVWGNTTNLYKRKCDITGEDIISRHAADVPFRVCSQKYWNSDEYDGIEYGRDYDFSRPFFEQFQELLEAVPHPCLMRAIEFDINSDYTNHAGKNKNCYMIFDSDFNEDCYYSFSVNKSKNCVDNYRIKECELCHECIDCVRCHSLKYSQYCENCSESAFLKNCIGCKRCFMCSNMNNKEYCIYNQQFDQKTYENLMNSLSAHSEIIKYFEDWKEFKLRYPQKYIHGFHNENVSGDYLVNCKNATKCFDSMELWDCKYVSGAFGSAKDCMDCDQSAEDAELLYENIFMAYNINNCRFCTSCVSESHDLTYCHYCFYSSDLFGCAGLKRKKFCILNKQYSEEEYKKMVPKIIEQMKDPSVNSGYSAWGEFPPYHLSPFAYNESLAQEFFPLTKEEALEQGFKWRDPDKKEYLPATMQIPDDSLEADDSILEGLFACEDCGRNYKIVEQELRFYKDQKVTLPKKCFYCRHKKRFDLRNKRDLYDRTCDKCQAEILTTYDPKQPEIVYCEKCYLESLH